MAVLFVDISESSTLDREHGDQKVGAIVAALLDDLERVVASFGGTVIDRIGDELMNTLPTARAALDAAVELQMATRRFSDERFPSGRRLGVRIGLHCGEITVENGRPSGRGVYRAKRVVDTAKAHQIVLDGETLDRIQDRAMLDLRALQVTVLKGQDGPASLFELVWNRLDATAEYRIAEMSEANAVALHIEAGDVAVRLKPHDHISIGRLPPCEVVARSSAVSRVHARIIGRTRGFYFLDESTNGSFVNDESEGGQFHFLHLEELLLTGFGCIGLGHVAQIGSAHTIRYSCISAETKVGSPVYSYSRA